MHIISADMIDPALDPSQIDLEETLKALRAALESLASKNHSK